MLGYGLRFLPKILSLRGSSESPKIMGLREQLVDNQIQVIIKDPGFTREQKRKLMQEITEGILDKNLKTEKSWSKGNYRKALQLAAKYPFYSQIKRKSPFIIMSMPMFGELV
jgi:hypothetical protein